MRQHYIYFLRLRGEIVYVGIAMDTQRREWQHRFDGKAFDQVDVSESYLCENSRPRCKGCGEGALREIGLIEEHQPIYNVRHNPSADEARIQLGVFGIDTVIGFVQYELTKWNIEDPDAAESKVIEQALIEDVFSMDSPDGFIMRLIRNRAIDQLRKEEGRRRHEILDGLISDMAAASIIQTS